ncbi:PAS domain S-box protein [Desulfobacterales bacterium HSG16]|nr:PAS domain S-box protein [Desulfobacterales bacterium HSG16]
MIDLRHSLVSKLIFAVEITLLVCILVWAYFDIKYQESKLMQHILAETARLGNTIKLGTHYAMMTNSRDDINQIINNIAKQPEIENIRIYNKNGEIKFSNRIAEVDQMTKIKAEACDVCHRFQPPVYELTKDKLTRLFQSEDGYRRIGIITPILNEPGCSKVCHIHPEDKKVLGALDVVLSMKNTDKEIIRYERWIIVMAFFMFFITSAIIFVLMIKFVNQPIKKLIDETRNIAKGDHSTRIEVISDDEIGQLSIAINQMNAEINRNHAELSKQKNEYQNLFDLVPCEISVQDTDYRLINFNRRFAERFNPEKGDFCFEAYKGLSEKCKNCPVEKTFKNGKPHYSEETGLNKFGSTAHWLVVTSPIKEADDRIVAAMEMSLDLTDLRVLEDKLEKSEKKYQAVFNNIPNPVFVLDTANLIILDCNDSVKAIYGYNKSEIMHKPFLNLFKSEDKDNYAHEIKSNIELNGIRQMTKTRKILSVDIRISPSEYEGQKVFLVTTSDITKRLEVEQQLIQASKMATLGEMATGVAHELNQPLSVIKMASSFFVKKINKGEKIKDEILFTMSTEIDSHVNRASKIINHMREFGRKAGLDMEYTCVNEVLRKAFEIFSQQLKLRGIAVIWDLDEDLPLIMAAPNCLEQVFINLLINARDAIEEHWEQFAQQDLFDMQENEKKIHLRTRTENNRIIAEVEDTGKGVDKELKEKIFEPFFTTKEVGKGTGLGLSISYGIVKDYGGTIKATPAKTESGKESGTVFIIEFPVAKL